MIRIPQASMGQAAYALFARQVATYDLPSAAAQIEWDNDLELRQFWHEQVVTVLAQLGLEPVGDAA